MTEEEEALLAQTYQIQGELGQADEAWTIQVIYPDERNVDSLLVDNDALIALEEPATDVAATEPPEKKWQTKEFACPNCSKVYNARKNLARHVNLECGKEPRYACPYCDYKNYRRNEMKKHARNKHHLSYD